MGTKLSAVEQIVLELCRENAHVSVTPCPDILPYMVDPAFDGHSYLQPISSGALQAKTPEINEDYVTNALNSLLNKHRLSILQQDGEISFQYISEGEALK